MDKKSFYQWDLDRRIAFPGVAAGTEIHFCNPMSKETECIPVVSYDEDGAVYADVPNEILQISGSFKVYVWPFHTTQYHQFTVIARPKPVDYVYTETEKHTVDEITREAVENAMREFDEASEEVLQSAQGAANEAKAAAKDAEASADEARASADGVSNALGDYVKKTVADNAFAPRLALGQGTVTRVWAADERGGSWIKTSYNAGQATSGNITRYLNETDGDNAVSGYLLTNLPTRPYQAANKKYVDDKTKDNVKNTDIASKDKAGVIKAENARGLYLAPEGFLAIRQATHDDIDGKKNFYNPITPNVLDYAVKAALIDNKKEWTEEDKAAAQALLGIKQTNFITLTSTDGKVTVPSEAKQYAQIKEIHGAISIYVQAGYQGYRDFVANYPKRIVTDTGAVLFELSDDALAHLPDFGLQGNYIYFEDGIAYYKQTTKREQYGYEPDNREGIIEEIYDGGCVVRIDDIVTDVSEYITFDGIIDTSGATSFSVEMRYTEEEVENMVADGYDNSYNDSYEYRMGKAKIAFEV